ncbi:DUF6203 family protein [Nonomuraea sp. KM88]|uniref:DUF6203 family protein n=1 Tax=Nonomuraea sp. KM88 TaxID=3457427 RepID=UPI003FCD2BB9
MKKLFMFFAAKWLTRTPLALAVLGLGWLLSRRRRQRQEGARPPERGQAVHRQVPRLQ